MLGKPFFGSVRLAQVSLILIGLMWTLPFLYPDHPRPIASFFGEWAAAVLGICAMLVTLAFWRQSQIPRIVLLPAALLSLVLLQFAMGRAGYFEVSLLYILYLLWAMLLMILARHLREELGLPALATALALSLLVGAELTALIGVLQHYAWHPSFNFLVMQKIGAAVFANLAQPNHLANYITLGLASLVLLYSQWKLRMWQLLLLATPLLFVLVLSGSRSPWLYFPCIIGLAFVWQRRDKSCLPLLQCSLLLLLGFGLMHFVVQIPWLIGPHGTVTAAQRLLEAGGAGGSLRLSIWREAWLIFTQNPLLGTGFGQFPWQHFQIGPVLRDNTISNLNTFIEHAHNLVLQLAAETGLAGLLILFGTLALWLANIYRSPRTVYQWWGCAVLTVLAIHSMLEYPLWYAYFLGVAAFTLGLLDDAPCPLLPRWNMGSQLRWLILAILLPGLLLLSQMLLDYKKLSDLFANLPQDFETIDEGSRQFIFRHARDSLLPMQKKPSMLRPNIESLLGESGWNHVADKRALNERAMSFAPYSSAVMREALLLARDGRPAEATVRESHLDVPS